MHTPEVSSTTPSAQQPKPRVLSDEQTESFDHEYMFPRRWEMVRQCLAKDFPNGEFCFVDIGGGNGMFADRVLAEFPKCTGTVLDISEALLARNKPNSRKRTILGSATDYTAHDERIDIIFFNWVLHHLVADNYGDTIGFIRSTLAHSRRSLSERGRISVFENMYDGWLFDGLPGRLIYFATSLKMLAPITRVMGANTGGVGVCFQSAAQWHVHFKESGLDTLRFVRDKPFPIPLVKQLPLFAHSIGPAHFWLSAAT